MCRLFFHIKCTNSLPHGHNIAAIQLFSVFGEPEIKEKMFWGLFSKAVIHSRLRFCARLADNIISSYSFASRLSTKCCDTTSHKQ